MNSLLPDDIDELKRLLAEQEALNRALLEKLNEREREIITCRRNWISCAG
ncbi:hypothetical protein ACVCG7_27645 (plasmid) [Klebsiella pneumoniae]